MLDQLGTLRKQFLYRAYKWNGSKPPLQVSPFEIIRISRLYIGKRKQVSGTTSIFLGEPDLIPPKDCQVEETRVVRSEN